MIISFLLIAFNANADNHDKKKKLVDQVKAINENIEEDEDEVPLNDPFAGNEGSSSTVSNLPVDEEDQGEMSLYNFKLVGLIAGKSSSYVSLVKSDGEPFSLTVGQYLGKIRLVDLRLSEVIFKKEDGKFIIIDFNNQIRETNEY
jgi:Tfp pilus assembly protein PilP